MFRGQYKFNNAVGVPCTYSRNDVVVYQGKVYKNKNTTQKSPLQSPNDWTYVNLSQPYKGTNAPANAKENQLWIADTGVMYIYFYDGNSYQWIAV
jgi:hypothetical protein